MSPAEKSSVHFQTIPDEEAHMQLATQRPITRAHLNLWKALTILFAATTLIQVPFSNVFLLSTYEHGFTTDFPASEGADRLVERRFSYPIRASADTGDLYVPIANSSADYPLPGQFSSWTDDAARYIGEPSPERDDAWLELTGPRYFALSGDERDWLHSDAHLNATTPLPTQPDAHKQPLAYAGLDVLHSLHCLDALRKRIDRADFPDSAPGATLAIDESSPTLAADALLGDGFERMHVEHCLNQLRESVMCHADTTPVTLRPVSLTRPNAAGEEPASVTVLLGETERMHTCRDFGRVRDWVRDMVEQRGAAA